MDEKSDKKDNFVTHTTIFFYNYHANCEKKVIFAK